MAVRENGQIIHFSDGQLALACGQLTLGAKAYLADCTGNGCRLEGTVTDGPPQVCGMNLTVISHDRLGAVISIHRHNMHS